jgi:hypothetical protein
LEINYLENEKKDLKNSFLELFEINDESIKINKDIFYINEINKNRLDYLNLFVDIVNFLQSHSKEIYYILELYDILHFFDSSTLLFLKSIISNQIINLGYLLEKNIQENKIIKNIDFFYMIESLTKLFNRNISLYIYNIITKPKKREIVFKSCQFFFQKVIKLEKRFSIHSREILSLKINMKLINHCEINKKIDIKEISFICNIIQIISENTQFLMPTYKLN